MTSQIPNVGDDIRVTGILPNDPAPLEIGDTGYVVDVRRFVEGGAQIEVDWVSGRKLMLMDTDPFEVVSEVSE